MTIAWESLFTDRAEQMRASEIRDLLKIIARPGVLSFAGGIPDPALFPSTRIAEVAAGVLSDPARAGAALQYSVSEGYAPLREWISGYMGERGVPCSIDNIVITTGSQQGLDFLGKLFIGPGDPMLVTAPTYLGALQAFNPYQPAYRTLTPGEAVGRDGRRPVLAYVVADFANPSGETLTRVERKAVLDEVTALGIPLIEDAAYEALRFRGEPEPSLLALDIARTGSIEASRVIYCGTFSKTVAPGFRVGWICAANELVAKVVLAKQAGDLHSSTLNQMIVHETVSTGFDEHIATLRGVYGGRQAAMLAALEESMPEGVTWTRPDGGMFIWVELPEGMDATALLVTALDEEGIAFVPGASFFADRSGGNFLRLNYTLATEREIADGIGRLGRLVYREMTRMLS